MSSLKQLNLMSFFSTKGNKDKKEETPSLAKDVNMEKEKEEKTVVPVDGKENHLLESGERKREEDDRVPEGEEESEAASGVKVKLPFKRPKRQEGESETETGSGDNTMPSVQTTVQEKVEAAVEKVPLSAPAVQEEDKKEVKEKGDTVSVDSGAEYEVEAILDYQWCREYKKGMYLVRWLGYSDDDNTWEPIQNLESCEEMLKEFYNDRLAKMDKLSRGEKKKLDVPPDPRSHFERRSAFIQTFFTPPCFSEIEAFHMKSKTKNKDKWLTDAKFNQLLDQLESKRKKEGDAYEALVAKVRHQLMLRHAKEAKDEQVKRLKAWESEINSIESATVRVTNDYDLEGPPRHMTYVTKYQPAGNIEIPDDPPIFCTCASACELKNESTCCPSVHGGLFPYTKFGRLRLDMGMPIYECNKKCACAKAGDCANRVVQKGRKTKLAIFKTATGKGWGAKTLENIKKGSFVVQYVGEVITSEEAEERGKKYDAVGRTYLFDLDFNLGEDNLYTVDAAFFGNVSHFINHSCDPNLAIFNVWADCLDPNLPQICLFAQRDIAKGEELTFDYKQDALRNYKFVDVIPPSKLKGGSKESTPEKEVEAPTEEKASEASSSSSEKEPAPSSPDSAIANRTECRCGAKNCRKFVFE